jgi:hypothetical protein
MGENLGDIIADGRIILKWILKKKLGRGPDSFSSR